MRQVLALVALVALLPTHAVAARASKATIHGRSMVVMNDTKPSGDQMWAMNNTDESSMEYPYPFMDMDDEYFIGDDVYSTPWSDAVTNVTLVVHFPETELASFDDDAFRTEFEAYYKRVLASGLDIPLANITILNITRGPAAGGSWNMTYPPVSTSPDFDATGEYYRTVNASATAASGRRLLNHDSDDSPNATYAGVRVHSVIVTGNSTRAYQVTDQLSTFYNGRGAFFEMFEPMEAAYGRVLLRRVFSNTDYYESYVPPVYDYWSDAVTNVTLVVHFPETELASFDDDAFRTEFEAYYKRVLASGLDIPLANITILNITRGPAAGGSWNMTYPPVSTSPDFDATGEYYRTVNASATAASGRRLLNHDSDDSPNATYAGVRVHSVIVTGNSTRAYQVTDQLSTFYNGRGAFFEMFEPMEAAYGRVLLRRVFSNTDYYDSYVPPVYDYWSDAVTNVTLVVHFPETELASFDDDAFRTEFEAYYKRVLASGLDIPLANITILNITRGPAAGGSWNPPVSTSPDFDATGEYYRTVNASATAASGRRLLNHDSDDSPNATYAGVRVHSVIVTGNSTRAYQVTDQLSTFYNGRGAFFEMFEPMEAAYGRVLLRRVFSNTDYYDSYVPSYGSPTYYGYPDRWSSSNNITVTALFSSFDFSNASATNDQLSAAIVRSVSEAMSVPVANVTVLNISRGPRERELMEPRTAVGSTLPTPETRRRLLSHGADSDFDPTATYRGTRVRFTVSLGSEPIASAWAERIDQSSSSLDWLFSSMVEEYGPAMLLRLGFSPAPGQSDVVYDAFGNVYRPTVPGRYPDDDSDDSDSERYSDSISMRHGVNMTLEFYLHNVTAARMRAPVFHGRVNSSLYELVSTADERLTPYILSCNITRFMRRGVAAMPTMAPNLATLYPSLQADGVLVEVNCSIGSIRAARTLTEIIDESPAVADWRFGPVTVISYSRNGGRRSFPFRAWRDDDSDSDDHRADDDDMGHNPRPTTPRDDDDDAADDSDSERYSDSISMRRGGNMTLEFYLHNVTAARMRSPVFHGRVNSGLYELVSTADERLTPYILSCNITRFMRRGVAAMPMAPNLATLYPSLQADGVLVEVNCSIGSIRAARTLTEIIDESPAVADWRFGPVTVISYSRNGGRRSFPFRAWHDDDSDSDDHRADDDDNDDAANDESDELLSREDSTAGEVGASPTSTTQPTVAPTPPPPTTPPPTTPPPTAPAPTAPPPTASPTVTPVVANITASASFDTLDITALENETYKQTFETDFKETMAANLPGVEAKNIDIIGYHQGSVVVDFVIQVTTEEQMDAMEAAVNSPEVVVSMLTPMVDKGYGEASLMAETVQVTILLSPPPPAGDSPTLAPSDRDLVMNYVEDKAVPMSNVASTLLLAALAMVALL